MPRRYPLKLSADEVTFHAAVAALLLSLSLAAAAAVSVFPPYMLDYMIISDEKTGALDVFALPAVISAVCVLLTARSCQRIKRTGLILLAASSLSVPAGMLCLRLGDSYEMCNFIPPLIVFSLFSAAAVYARIYIKSGTGKTAAAICSFPLAALLLFGIMLWAAGHVLFATAVYLYLLIPMAAFASLSAAGMKRYSALSGRTATLAMLCAIPFCSFCSLRVYGFDTAYAVCAALSLIIPAMTVISFISDIKKHKNKKEFEMSNQTVAGLGFHHIALKASDFEKSYKFYTEGLGMTPYTTWGEGDSRIQMLDIGDGSILELFAGGRDIPDGGRYIHFAMKCDDVDKAFDAAVKAGGRVKSEPKTVPLDSKPVKLTLRCAFVYGPDGEELEFFKVL